MKVCILMGGDSQEREISLASGYAVSNALQRKGHFVKELDGTLDNVKSLNQDDFDAVFIALHGGDGENGNVQAVLDDKGMLYTGSDALASRRGIDKICAKEFMIQEGIPTPKYILFSNKIGAKSGFFVEQDMFPCIVKPRYEGSSFGLSKVDKKEDLQVALDNCYKYGSDVLVEEYIKGRELTVAVIGEEALPIVEVVPGNDLFDFESKYSKGMTEYIVPASLSEELEIKIKDLAVRFFKSLGCRDYARIDIMLDSAGNPYILEVNTVPGFTETSLVPKSAKVIGVDFDDLCELLLKKAVNRLIESMAEVVTL